MRFTSANESHFDGICALVSSAEQLYLIHPNAVYPWDHQQLFKLMDERQDLTVLLENDQVVGFANLYKVMATQSAFLGNVVIAHSHRGRGLGKALVAHMATICTQKYQATPHLAVFNDNTAALLLYAQMGFVPYALEARQTLANKPTALLMMAMRSDTLSDD